MNSFNIAELYIRLLEIYIDLNDYCEFVEATGVQDEHTEKLTQHVDALSKVVLLFEELIKELPTDGMIS